MYNDFDQQCYPVPRGATGYRTPFAIDRDRIVHSRAFRRLQAKTQVFSSGEYDFYRTRLTHSVEVSQIGRSMCRHLASLDSEMPELDLDLIEAACLTHDLGNPPFGHSGERTLHACMKEYGGFEGNAQTLRLITQRIFTEDSGRTGIKPTRAFMDAVCKYKGIFVTGMDNHFLYEDQADCVNFIHGNQDTSGQSIECQIMDWADDIANGYADVNDGYKARLISVQSLEDWRAKQNLDNDEDAELSELLKSMKKGDIEKFRARGIGKCIMGTQLIHRTHPLATTTQRYALDLQVNPAVKKYCGLMKKIAFEIVIKSALVQQLEWKTDQMLAKLFQTLLKNYMSSKPKALLPRDSHEEVVTGVDERAKARFICDHLSGMSDDFAVRTYRRLFDPTFGSIGDFI